mgnify:CR=1 FL=1
MEAKIKDKILSLNHVSMRYHTLTQETLAVEDVNLEVYDKEFLSIVGPSGCGKSTMLSLISGLISPSAGEVVINSKFKKNSGTLVGYMLQSDYLFEWRTIEQNVLLGLEIKNILNEKSRDYAIGLLEKYELGKFKNHFPSQLSGGMRQKVALIRTLAVKPQVLLLDEPFSALDYQTRITLAEEVREIIKTESKTAVLVTHDISESITLSDRVAILSKRPSKIKRILDIEFKSQNLSTKQKQRSEEFYNYFDVIWSELNENEKSKS